MYCLLNLLFVCLMSCGFFKVFEFNDILFVLWFSNWVILLRFWILFFIVRGINKCDVVCLIIFSIKLWFFFVLEMFKNINLLVFVLL